jgi:protein SCO1
MSPRYLLLAAVAVLAVVTGVYLSLQLATPPPQPRVATVLPVAGDVPDFSLLDPHGRSIGREVFVGQWDLVFFGFTHCPDVCPLTLQVLAEAKNTLGRAGLQPLPRIVFVSVDPERDTPELMGRYVDHFGDGNLGVTGDLPEILKLTRGLGIFFAKTRAEGGNYSVDHSAVVLVIDPDGKLDALFSAPHVAANFVHDLPIVMAR